MKKLHKKNVQFLGRSIVLYLFNGFIPNILDLKTALQRPFYVQVVIT